MDVDERTIPVQLGFMPDSVAIADPDHPGLLRAGPRASGPYAGESVEVHVCSATDICQDDSVQPDLLQMGFTTVDLSCFDDLQRVFASIRATASISEADAAAIRTGLDGATLHASDGLTLTVLHLADEGLIMRKSGPNGMSVVGPRSQGMNGHGAATSIHADQDVYGTPLKQLMEGRAPSLFRHASPDAHNDDAGLMLLNMWVPLQQIIRPLVLADGRSLDRRRHQLRYGLATESFLDRDDEMAINDIWTFLHDPEQRWYFRSEMDHRSAYVFNTLSTAHGSGILPGEDVAEACYRALEAGEIAVAAGDAAALSDAMSARLPPVPQVVTPALRDAISAMAAVMDEAASEPAAVCGQRSEEWLAAARDARGRVVRMSLELRMVVSIESDAAAPA